MWNRFKVKNKHTRITPQSYQWRQWRRSGIFIVNFEHISHLILVFLPLTLNMQLPIVKGVVGCEKCYYQHQTSINARKCPNTELFLDQKQIRIWTLFTQWCHIWGITLTFKSIGVLHFLGRTKFIKNKCYNVFLKSYWFVTLYNTLSQYAREIIRKCNSYFISKCDKSLS